MALIACTSGRLKNLLHRLFTTELNLTQSISPTIVSMLPTTLWSFGMRVKRVLPVLSIKVAKSIICRPVKALRQP